ncbi:type I polyketide synthase, partial [Nocardia sp. NPDC046473]|uniref:type I polyketide synthase n=1 Tax=Nocardia sp. NPDC046473 TaxID=3155733 RepID=UPI0033D27C22
GQVSLVGQSWWADHAVAGTVVIPGAALLEWVVSAGQQLGCAVVSELTLQVPVLVPADTPLDVRVVITSEPTDTTTGAGLTETEVRKVVVHTRPAGDDGEWTTHATGTLTSDTATGIGADPGALDAAGVVHGQPLSRGEAESIDTAGFPWPPVGAEAVDIAGLYDELATAGLEYGPMFQGVQAAWRAGEQVWVEVELPGTGAAGGFTAHPALLDAILHGIAFGDFTRDPARTYLPFAWSGVRLQPIESASVRCQLTPAGPDAIAIIATDEHNNPVLTVDSVALRAVRPDEIGARGNYEHLFQVEWQPVDLPAAADTVAVIGDPHTLPGAATYPDLAAFAAADAATFGHVVFRIPADAAASLTVVSVLQTIQWWLGESRWQDSRLVFLVEEDGATAGAVRGLVRAARAEHPDRFGLVVLGQADTAPLPWMLTVPDGEVLLRDGKPWVQRLARVSRAAAMPLPFPSGDAGWVLITGGLGTIGSALARHLVVRHGVRRLVLTGRSGPAADGAAELVAELTVLGAEVQVVACDVADSAAVHELAGRYRFTGAVHAAGALADALVTELDPDRLAVAYLPKADGMANLHAALPAEVPMVAFSSLAAVFGAPGQANYAAANGFLDGYARQCRTAGRPVVSIAWGFWEDRGAMTDHLDDKDLRRLRGSGVEPLSTDDGLALFDAAVAAGLPNVVAARFDLAGLRAQDSAEISPLYRGLIRTSSRTEAEPKAGDARGKLAALTGLERAQALEQFVRRHVAAVLGHDRPDTLSLERGFLELGFDSLTAVDLRNRLSRALNLRLPATLMFDYPDAAALAGYLDEQLGGGDERSSTPVDQGLDRLAALLAAADPDQAERSRLAARLRELLTTFDSGAETVDVTERLESASDSEMFEFIDNELGVS